MNAPRTRVPRRPVHGVLLIDKPLGWTSNDVLQKVKGQLRAEKAGHTGTLDPLATGLLPLCFGAATKFSQVQLDADKTYEALIRLGQTTATGDAEGEVTATCAVPPLDDSALLALARRMIGPQMQVPPMTSALKVEGRALYTLARAGQTVERAPRAITVHALELAFAPDHPACDAITMIATVSKGTYIRVLAEDIGAALGCGAHLRGLRRVATGPFHIDQALPWDAWLALSDAQRLARLLPVQSLLAGWPVVQLANANEAQRFCSGLARRVDHPDAAQVAATDPDGHLLGSAQVTQGQLIPTRILNEAERTCLRAGPAP